MFAVSVSGWVFGVSNTSLAETSKPFDHSQCQYPYRASNPVDGCDNSDPACPLEIKGGSCESYVPTPEEITPYIPPAVTEPAITPAPTVVCK